MDLTDYKQIIIHNIPTYFYINKDGDIWNDNSKRYANFYSTNKQKPDIKNQVRVYTPGCKLHKNFHKDKLITEYFGKDDEFNKKYKPLKYNKKIIPNYFISCDGELYSTISEKVFTRQTLKNDYQVYRIVVGNVYKTWYVHHMVMETWNSPKPKPIKGKRYEINHIDRNRSNNHHTNLEWMTRLQNMRHSWKSRTNKRVDYEVDLYRTLYIKVENKSIIVNNLIEDSIKEYPTIHDCMAELDINYGTLTNRAYKRVCINGLQFSYGDKITERYTFRATWEKLIKDYYLLKFANADISKNKILNKIGDIYKREALSQVLDMFDNFNDFNRYIQTKPIITIKNKNWE